MPPGSKGEAHPKFRQETIRLSPAALYLINFSNPPQTPLHAQREADIFGNFGLSDSLIKSNTRITIVLKKKKTNRLTFSSFFRASGLENISICPYIAVESQKDSTHTALGAHRVQKTLSNTYLNLSRTHAGRVIHTCGSAVFPRITGAPLTLPIVPHGNHIDTDA